MRLALVGNHPPLHGGVAVHVATLARALRARGDDVRVIDVGREVGDEPGIVAARGALRYAAALAAAARERRLLHVHTGGANPKSWTVALAAARVRLPGAPPPVLTLHSGLLPAYLAGGEARRAVARATCAAYGRVVAVSRPVAEAVEACGVAAAKLLVLPAFLDRGLTPAAPPPALVALRRACAPLFSAALAPTPTYGEDLLLAAFGEVRAHLPRAALAVFGPGTERGPSAAAGPGGAVLALGPLERGAALAVMAASDVFVRPTRADGDAISVREALVLGRAVVASALGHRPPGCLLFRPGRVEELAARMLEAAASPPPSPAGLAPAEEDPLEALLRLYRSSAPEGRPIPSRSSPGAERPCSSA